MSWICQNILTFALLAVLSLVAWRLSRREYWRLAWRELCGHRAAMVCGVILAVYAAIAVADSIGWRRQLRDENGAALRNPDTGKILYDDGCSALDYLLTSLRTRREKTYSAPLAATQFTAENGLGDDGKVRRIYPELRYPRSHLLGTDRVGGDVFYQALKSIRTGLIIGLLTTLAAIPFSLVAGLSAGYYGGIVDDAIQYVYSVLNSIPTVLFVAAFMLICGQGLPQLCLAMGISSWTSLCRLVRAETLKLREMEYVQASTILGQPSWLIICRHIVPNLLHVVLITTVLRFSSEVLAEAALTYLGIGVGANTYSWGTMINEARTELTRDPIIWWKLAAAFAFMLGLVLPANIFGDAIRDALDPKLRTK